MNLTFQSQTRQMFAAFLCDGACTRAKEGLFGAGCNKNLKVLINILTIITQSLSWSTDEGGCPTRFAQSSSLLTKSDQNQKDRPGTSPMITSVTYWNVNTSLYVLVQTLVGLFSWAVFHFKGGWTSFFHDWHLGANSGSDREDGKPSALKN